MPTSFENSAVATGLIACNIEYVSFAKANFLEVIALGGEREQQTLLVNAKSYLSISGGEFLGSFLVRGDGDILALNVYLAVYLPGSSNILDVLLLPRKRGNTHRKRGGHRQSGAQKTLHHKNQFLFLYVK